MPHSSSRPGADAGLPSSDLRRALDRLLADSLGPVTAGLAVLFLVLSASYPLLLTSEVAARTLSTLAAVSAALLLAALFVLRARGPGSSRANAWAVAVALLVLANCLAQIAVTGELRHTSNLVLLLLGAGFLLVSTRWFLAVAAVALAGWLAVVLSLPNPTAPGHYSVTLLEALLLATLVHHVRVRSVTRLQQEYHARSVDLAARQHAEAQRAALLEAVPDLFFRVRRDGTFLDVHAGTPEDLLLAPEQFVGRAMQELPFPEELRERTLAAIARALAGQGIQSLEYALALPGGERAYEARVVRSGPDEAVVISRNVTERQRAERALRHSEERYRSLFDVTPLPVWVFDVKTLAFLAVNDAAVRHYGYTRDEFLGLTLEQVNAPEHRDLVRAIPGREHPPEERSGVWTHVKKDGTRFEVEIATHALVFDDRPARCAVLEDVTARRRVERFKDQLVGIAAHELRSPLTAVHGSLELILGGSPNLSATQMAALRLALRNSGRMARLIDDLLDVERAESGQLALERERVQLGDVLVEALGLSAPLAERLGVALRLSETPAGAAVLGDLGRLAQVVTNLVTNALTFSPPGESVLVSCTRREDVLRVEVADRGPGVPEGFRPRLFQRFAQAREPGTQRKGSGLGLAISRAIVENLGGSIGYQPREGGGSLFFFELAAANVVERIPSS